MEAWIDDTCPGYWWGAKTVIEVSSYSDHNAAVRSLLGYLAHDAGGYMLDCYTRHPKMRTMKFIKALTLAVPYE